MCHFKASWSYYIVLDKDDIVSFLRKETELLTEQTARGGKVLNFAFQWFHMRCREIIHVSLWL